MNELVFFTGKQKKGNYNTNSNCTHLQILQIHQQAKICKIAQFPLSIESLYSKGIHGIEHAYRVLLLVQKLANIENLPVHQKKLLEFCAIFHDIGRINDDVDYFHGQRSIALLRLHKFFNLAQFDNQLTKYIITNHCINDDIAFKNIDYFELNDINEAIFLLKVFKDADNLDRFRIGDFDSSFLRNNNSHQLIKSAIELNNFHFTLNETINEISKLINRLYF